MTADARRRGSRPAFARIVATILLWPSEALAWNAAGHRLTAGIAWEFLHPAAREQAVLLLRSHPDHARWLRRTGTFDDARKAFIEASTWPDEIRKDTRFYSASKEVPTPTFPGFPDMERRSNWHYVNIPIEGSPEGRALFGELRRRLPELIKRLRESTDERERSYALPWLIHLVGDAHQPLHASARVNRQGRWDRQGNNLQVNNPFNSRKPLMTLHSFWDDLPGSCSLPIHGHHTQLPASSGSAKAGRWRVKLAIRRAKSRSRKSHRHFLKTAGRSLAAESFKPAIASPTY